jgi:hypothetical protein
MEETIRKLLTEEITKLREENEELKRKMLYITDSNLFTDRYDDNEQKIAVKNKWSVADERSGMLCGNIKVIFNNNIASLIDFMPYSRENVPSYRQISSALALYRCISLFECGLNPELSDFYKSNWTIHLKHKSTNIICGLSEWKGAFGVYTPYSNINQVDPIYKKDVEELLTLLVSPTLTIGYDGTVAGTVA